MTNIYLDFETRSEAEIKNTGAWRYAADPSTEILCLAYAIDDGPTHIVLQKDIDAALSRLCCISPDAPTYFIAHNAYFEQSIWRNCSKTICPPISQWRCTAAKAAVCSLPRSLDGCAKALGLPAEKDMTGYKLMMKMCKPRPMWKKTGQGEKWHMNTEDLNRLAHYCAQDVEVERLIWKALPNLNKKEQAVWELDQAINLRGVHIDMGFVEAGIYIFNQKTKRVQKTVQEKSKYTLENTNQVAKLKAWLANRNIIVESLAKANVAELLEREDLTDEVREILLARQESSKTSVAKLTAMVDAIDPQDNRIKDLYMYHAAHTGRWGGKLVQLQNLPRGTVKDTDTCIDFIKQRDVSFLEEFYGSASAAVSSCIRGAITAPAGKKFYVADFAAIEARVLLWLAGDEEGLNKFRRGEDLYVDMARVIYSRSQTDEITKEERQLGKSTILGCLAKDTLVLTDAGWTRIQYVTPLHRVWDGIEWVKTGGAICRGIKETIEINGMRLTPDHKVLTQNGWKEAAEVLKEKENYLVSALFLARSGLKDIISGREAEFLTRKSHALVIDLKNTRLISIISEMVKRLGVMFVPKKHQLDTENTSGVMKILYRMNSTGRDYSTESAQSSLDVSTKTAKPFTTMGEEGSLSILSGDGIGELFCNTWYLCQDGTIRNLRSIESITKQDMPPGILGLLTGLLNWLTGDTYQRCRTESCTSRTKIKTYDLVYCGPRNRFTVATSAGPIIVHNCGFGMGHSKFYQTCIAQGVSITERTAEIAVKSYRKLYSKVANCWRTIEQAAAKAVQSRDIVLCEKTKWKLTNNSFLITQLPSGRNLFYYRPELSDGKLCFFSVNSVTRKFELQSTWGGTITENCVQAIARDLMAEAMLRLEAKGYTIALHTHDEIIAEVDENFGSLDEFVSIMEEVPEWAAGCPIKAEGWQGTRYRK